MSAPEDVAGYRVLDTLGQGGEGQVFLAESTDGLAKRVALKCFAADARAQYERERDTYRRIEETRVKTHTPHLVEGLAAGDLPDGGGYVALAYHTGGTLADRVKAEGPLDAQEAGRIVRQILSGLRHLHEAGLCHRDVKPHNVLIGTDGLARLGDFGLSRETDGAISAGGTPAFAAPEQWSVEDGNASDEADALQRSGSAIDVYGTGATLYYLLTGRSPPPGAPDLFLLESRKVPRELQRVLITALAAQPEQRYADAGAFSAALDAWSQRLPLVEAPGAVAALRGWADQRPPAQLGALALAGVALLVWAAWPAGDPPATTAPASPSASTPLASSSASTPPPDASPSLARATPRASPPTADPTPDVEPSSPLTTPAQPGRFDVLVGDAGAQRVTWVRSDQPTLELGRYGPGPLTTLYLPLRDEAVIAAPPTAEAGARLDLYDAQGRARGQVPLPGAVSALLEAPASRLVVGTLDGLVLLIDPAQLERPPRELVRFARSVTRLELQGDVLVAAGDDRQPTLLADGEDPPAGSLVIEGALGRYAYPRDPVLRTVELPLRAE